MTTWSRVVRGSPEDVTSLGEKKQKKKLEDRVCGFTWWYEGLFCVCQLRAAYLNLRSSVLFFHRLTTSVSVMHLWPSCSQSRKSIKMKVLSKTKT